MLHEIETILTFNVFQRWKEGVYRDQVERRVRNMISKLVPILTCALRVDAET